MVLRGNRAGPGPPGRAASGLGGLETFEKSENFPRFSPPNGDRRAALGMESTWQRPPTVNRQRSRNTTVVAGSAAFPPPAFEQSAGPTPGVGAARRPLIGGCGRPLSDEAFHGLFMASPGRGGGGSL